MSKLHEHWMLMALEQARIAASEDEVPVGAVVVRNGECIAKAHNRRESDHDPLAHAEMLAIHEAARVLGRRKLSDCTLYVTLEPCPMCAGAIVMAELGACFYGARDTRQGCCESIYAIPEDPAFFHQVTCTGGILEEECGALLQDFFKTKR